jgi:hypothetical protein
MPLFLLFCSGNFHPKMSEKTILLSDDGCNCATGCIEVFVVFILVFAFWGLLEAVGYNAAISRWIADDPSPPHIPVVEMLTLSVVTTRFLTSLTKGEKNSFEEMIKNNEPPFVLKKHERKLEISQNKIIIDEERVVDAKSIKSIDKTVVAG